MSDKNRKNLMFKNFNSHPTLSSKYQIKNLFDIKAGFIKLSYDLIRYGVFIVPLILLIFVVMIVIINISKKKAAERYRNILTF